MKSISLIFALSAIASLAACGGDDDCQYTLEDRAPGQSFRNPDTGRCEFLGGGGGRYSCDGDVWPADVGGGGSARAALEAVPAWGTCYGMCDGLSDADCQATPGCQSGYSDGFFYECWEVAPIGGTDDIPCELVADALTCAGRDGCIKHHGSPFAAADSAAEAPFIGPYERCESEVTGCYSDDECGSSEYCTADTECLPPPGCNSGACPAVCYGRCLPDKDPGSCTGTVTCDAPAPLCNVGSSPGIADGCYTGSCIPNAQCGSQGDPGNCYGEAICAMPAPACPEGTLPGIKNSCWTGYCIPVNMCEAPPSCGERTSEVQCITQGGCVPTYTGINCECTGDACNCTDWVFDTCENPPPP